MRRLLVSAILPLFGVVAVALSTAGASVSLEGVELLSQKAEMEFPLGLTFSAEVRSAVDIEEALLIYEIKARQCVEVESVAWATLQAGETTVASWRWDMRRTGGLPPGTVIEHRWVITDAEGRTLKTEVERTIYQDERFAWREVSTEGIQLRWYRGDEAFAATLLQAAQEAIALLEEDTGVALSDVVIVYIYGSASDLRSSLVFPQEWTGGVAFPSFKTIMLGIPPSSLDWGSRVVAHELSHIAIDRATSNCYAGIPSWLAEGLATYAEGELSPDYGSALERARDEDGFSTVRALSRSFPTSGGEALVAYAQSHSLIDFLIQRYERESIGQLLDRFQEGMTADGALTATYGFDQAGLEARWRAWMGLPAREEAMGRDALPTPIPIPPLALEQPITLQSDSRSRREGLQTALDAGEETSQDKDSGGGEPAPAIESSEHGPTDGYSAQGSSGGLFSCNGPASVAPPPLSDHPSPAAVAAPLLPLLLGTGLRLRRRGRTFRHPPPRIEGLE